MSIASVHVHTAISFSDTLFCSQSSPVSGTFPMSWLFTSDYQNTGASALASVLPTNIQGWFLLRLTGLLSLVFKGLPGVFSSTKVWRYQFFGTLTSLRFSFHMTIRKTIALTIWIFVGRVMSLLFNTRLGLSQLSCQEAVTFWFHGCSHHL